MEALIGLEKEDWRGLLHVTISPLPRAGEVRPDILHNGLSLVGSNVIPQDIWEETVPMDFYGDGGERILMWRSPRWIHGATRGREHRVGCRMMSHSLQQVLRKQWLLYDLHGSPTPTCWLFIIPKMSGKVSRILSCVA